MELDEEDEFITKYNSLARYFSVPKTFVEPLLEKIYQETEAKNNEAYNDLGNYLTPNPLKKDQPPPEVKLNRRVYGFIIFLNTMGKQKAMMVRSDAENDEFYLCSPDFGSMGELMEFYHQQRQPYPEFEFDAKWKLMRMDLKAEEEAGEGEMIPNFSRKRRMGGGKNSMPAVEEIPRMKPMDPKRLREHERRERKERRIERQIADS